MTGRPDPNVPAFSTAQPGDPLYERHAAVKTLMDRITAGEINEDAATQLMAEYDREHPDTSPNVWFAR